MIIFSHRGEGFGLEENSLESFKEALNHGFSIEIDVQKTRDNHLIIIHDNDLSRLRGINKKIEELNYEEAEKLNIALFSEVLKIFKETKNSVLAIHVKNEEQRDILKLLAGELEKYNIFDRCFLFDLTIEGAKKIKKINEKIAVGFSVGEKRFTKTIYLWDDIKNENFDAVWWDEWNSGLYTKENLDKIREKNKKVYAIAPDLHHIHNHPLSKERKKEGWLNLINLEVDGICTDYPKELRNFIEENS